MEANELSEREREILQLVATGASNKEIAQRLVISPNTVKVHLRNIFTKIGVASRTEAAMVALRSNIVQSSVTPATGEATIPPVEVAPPTPVQAETFLPTKRRSNLRLWIILAILFLLGSGSLWILFNLVYTTRANQSVAEAADALSQPPRWLKLTNMPSARCGLAAVVYGNLIYTFGGTSLTGVTGAVECYEPDKERWLIYTSKPTPVTDIQAAVIGGRIYIPGGKTTAGQPTDILEIYNPLNDTWEQGTNLPVPLSAYSLAAFEGRLFIFGGWNGEEFTASVYEYDFNRGLWVERTPMPTARSYTSAAVAGRKIYVLGGYNKDGALPTNEVYSPDWESSVNTPWAKAA